jgi:hypothetical protein
MTGSTYTAEEIANYLRVHPYTVNPVRNTIDAKQDSKISNGVKRLARAGKIPGFKVGGQCRANVNN